MSECEGQGRYVDFINSIHLGYTEAIKQPEIKSNTRGDDAIKRCSKHEMSETAASLTGVLFHSKHFLSRTSTL